MSISVASVNNIMDKWGKYMLQQPNITYDTARGQQLLDQSTTFYKKHCFYCHKTFQTNRTGFVDHLFQHGFQLGRPNKLVYIERLVNIIQDLFESYKCLFCFNKFTTKLDMIKHMNEYGHNRIDPENNFFDQFYIVNYMELKQSDTILLIQLGPKPETRSYSHYESVNKCMEGVCKIYAEHLKRLNPNTHSITYFISQLFDFIDQLADLSCLVYQKGTTTYALYNKEWIKEKIYLFLRRKARFRRHIE